MTIWETIWLMPGIQTIWVTENTICQVYKYRNLSIPKNVHSQNSKIRDLFHSIKSNPALKPDVLLINLEAYTKYRFAYIINYPGVWSPKKNSFGKQLALYQSKSFNINCCWLFIKWFTLSLKLINYPCTRVM